MLGTHSLQSVQINGPALRQIRELRGRSCSDVARSVGVDVSFLARVERGEKKGVNVGTFRGIVAELGLVDGRSILVNPYDETVARVTSSSTSLGLTLGTPLRTVPSSKTSTAA